MNDTPENKHAADSGLDDATCSAHEGPVRCIACHQEIDCIAPSFEIVKSDKPLWWILRFHWIGLVWSIFSLAWLVWLFVGVIHKEESNNLLFIGTAVGYAIALFDSMLREKAQMEIVKFLPNAPAHPPTPSTTNDND